MPSRYADAHKDTAGPGDARPTAQQIIDDNDLNGKLVGKVAFVTGCSSGIGIETARALKSTGAKVYATVRDLEKGKKALQDSLEPGKLELLELDLNSLASVNACADEFLSKNSTLNILINNAGIMALPERVLTKDGHESQFGVNHLAHFLLFQRLKPTLLASATPDFPSKVVDVSSSAHLAGEVHFDDLTLEKEGVYGPWVGYGQAKTANIYMANEIDRRYSSKHLRAFSLHPGGIWTGLQQHVDFSMFKGKPEVEKGMKSAAQGAATSVYAALDREMEGKGGLYLEDCDIAKATSGSEKVMRSGYATWAYDVDKAKRLWVESCKLVGVNDD